MHSRFTVIIVLDECAAIIERGQGWWSGVAGSDWMWWIRGWHVYQEYLRDIPYSRESMSGRSSMGEIESRRVYPTILAVDAMEDGEYMRHGSGGYKAGGDSGTAFLLCNLFLH